MNNLRVYHAPGNYLWYPEGVVGEYIVKYVDRAIFFHKNKMLHNKNGAAKIWNDGYKEYYLDNKCYGTSSRPSYNKNIIHIPSDEYWVKWQKLRAFR